MIIKKTKINTEINEKNKHKLNRTQKILPGN